MNYFNPLLLLHHDQSSRSFSHNFCFLSQAHQDNTILYLWFISSKQSPNRSISSYSIISMFFLPSSSVCVWSSLKWKPRYFHSHFSILIFLCQYCLIYSFLDHNEKIVPFFYLVLQSLWLVKKNGENPYLYHSVNHSIFNKVKTNWQMLPIGNFTTTWEISAIWLA